MNREAPPVVKAMHDLILAWVRQVLRISGQKMVLARHMRRRCNLIESLV
jgi:hypothetical protein